MIFVTVGTDMPFDRLVKQVDAWAASRGRNDVFAQIGEGGWKPAHIRFAEFLQPPEFVERFKSASIVISHAGMGTILSALHYGKPILVMPKRASLREHRNEHQLATAQRMMEMANVNVAFDENELREKLDHLDQLVPSRKIGTDASDSLISGLRAFIGDSARK
jgi:UDP-N-acetylglucosamine transferase subunit ALG13